MGGNNLFLNAVNRFSSLTRTIMLTNSETQHEIVLVGNIESNRRTCIFIYAEKKSIVANLLICENFINGNFINGNFINDFQENVVAGRE